MGKKAKTVKRKIYFYRMFFERDQSGIAYDAPDILKALEKIKTLDYTTPKPYHQIADGCSICGWIDGDDPGRVILGTVRSELPLTEEKGVRAPLSIPATKNILECTHMIFFQDGILGSEFNFYGPRAIKLAAYIAAMFPTVPAIHIVPLTDRNVSSKLNALEDIKVMKLALHRNYFALLRQSQKSMEGVFNALEELSNAPMIEVMLRNEPRSKKPLGPKVKDVVTSLAINDDIREAAQRFEVRATTTAGKTATFDFLSDLFAISTQVLKQEGRTRAVNTDSMFTAIENAYTEKREELKHAAGLEL